MSPLLKEFLKDWLAWVDAGAPNGQPFLRCIGLCYSFEHWMDSRKDKEGVDQDEDICSLMDAFQADGLSRAFPFGGCIFFCEESDAEEMHRNPARIAWVRSKIAQKQEA